MTGPHVRITWHVAHAAAIGWPAAAARVTRHARAHGVPVTVSRHVGAVDPWPTEHGLTVVAYLPTPTDPALAGRFARVLADAFAQESVIWTEDYVTLNETKGTNQ